MVKFDPTNTFNEWNFNYDAGRVPMFLGAYLSQPVKKGSNKIAPRETAKTIITREMGSKNEVGLNSFFNYQDPSNGFSVGGLIPNTGAPIFSGGVPQTGPEYTPSDQGGYTDDFLNTVFFLGNIGKEGINWTNQGLNNPSTWPAVQLMTSFGGAYYDGAYKAMGGMILNGAFGETSIKPNQFVLNEVSQKPLIIFNKDTYAFLYTGQVKPYYMNLYIAPGTMKANTDYYVKVIGKSNVQGTTIDFQNYKLWGGVPTDGDFSSKGSNCAVMKIAATRTDYFNIGLINIGGNAIQSPYPTFTYTSSTNKLSCN